MSQDAYTLKQKKDTEELHLFRGSFTENENCTSGAMSICQKMKTGESVGNCFACKTEDAARTECATIGRQVCGICVSALYETYK